LILVLSAATVVSVAAPVGSDELVTATFGVPVMLTEPETG
jgi:hypothetical protein